MDLDLRKLRYFAAVAEHRHFGRAAEQLYIAQPVLSRQIKAFEQELDCALLTRTTRAVELTPAGKQLYEEAQGILAAVGAGGAPGRDAPPAVGGVVQALAPGHTVYQP
ncbi:LysR family transcriptional regulator, partial [Nocardia tengchongensis]|uniref:LysR family transcriptional regulator n=1 Tax=Nocardia tengchongensis TaxID=2055889 RepID=UPI0036749BBF